MDAPAGVPSQLLRGVLEYCVLGMLQQQDFYAFDLVRALSDRGMAAKEGTIYPLLARLRREELVETSWQESSQGPPRRYYQLTAKGAGRLGDFIKEWAAFRDSVDSIISVEER